ncbi:MAG TPA: amylo-alpha-1,6-glucosidase, partial [Gemmatimonadaceae bacterium]
SGDSDGDGYIDYRSDANANGRLVNQGWKDSGDAIVDANGDIVEIPVALVELQGYAYAARNAVARLLEQSGETERAAELRREAETLRSRFNRDFWSKNIDFLALALHGDTHMAAEVVASNAGHALWSGIVDDRYAERVVRRLLEEDMNSGWGIRTLSTQERAYNPVGYHLGTVWPHDNALIVAGFRRYGYDDEACQLFADLLDAATYFDHYRLPEVFAGFSRSGYEVPVRYPVACHPQAWAAGSIPYLLQSLLGLDPDAFARRLTVVRPRLPGFIDMITLSGVRVGDATVDLRFERDGDAMALEVERLEGDLEVVVRDSAAEARTSATSRPGRTSA